MTSTSKSEFLYCVLFRLLAAQGASRDGFALYRTA